MAASDSRVKEVGDFFSINGWEKTVETFSVSNNTLNKYLKRYKKFDNFDKKTVLKKISEKYSDAELQALLKSSAIKPDINEIKASINFNGDTFKFGYITDTHIGSSYTTDEVLKAVIDHIKLEKCDFVVHSGDVVEGMSNRPGHVYELSHIGYDAQKNHAIKLFKRFDGLPIYVIDGNHDRWYIKSNGGFIVKDIAEQVEGMVFIGHDSAEFMINDIKIMPWHGEDGSSYATSYRIQKVIESLQGGTKPQILLCGHTHKHGYFFERNIHAVSGGCIQFQTGWMKGKRLSAHTGFWIIEVTSRKGEIIRFKPEWIPIYRR